MPHKRFGRGDVRGVTKTRKGLSKRRVVDRVRTRVKPVTIPKKVAPHKKKHKKKAAKNIFGFHHASLFD